MPATKTPPLAGLCAMPEEGLEPPTRGLWFCPAVFGQLWRFDGTPANQRFWRHCEGSICGEFRPCVDPVSTRAGERDPSRGARSTSRDVSVGRTRGAKRPPPRLVDDAVRPAAAKSAAPLEVARSRMRADRWPKGIESMAMDGVNRLGLGLRDQRDYWYGPDFRLRTNGPLAESRQHCPRPGSAVWGQMPISNALTVGGTMWPTWPFQKAAMDIRLKRAHEPVASADGFRVLIDRLWPRGISRERAQLDAWEKELAPSTELRQWFGHEPKRFQSFAAATSRSSGTSVRGSRLYDAGPGGNPDPGLLGSRHRTQRRGGPGRGVAARPAAHVSGRPRCAMQRRRTPVG